MLMRRLSRSFSVPIQIQRLSFSPQRLILHEVRFPLLSLKRLQLERPFQKNRPVTVTGLTLSVAGIPLQAHGRVDVTMSGGAATCEGWLAFEHPLLKGHLEMNGSATEPVLLGWLATPQGIQRRFLAQGSIRPEGVELTQMEIEGGWRASGKMSRLAGSGSVKGRLELEGPEDRFLLEIEPSHPQRGGLNLLMGRQEDVPRKLTARWFTERRGLHFKVQSLGEEAYLNGWVEPSAPHRLQMLLEFNGIQMQELFQPFFKGGVSPISGQMKGWVQVEGTLGQMVSQGTLTSQDGKFFQTPFSWAALRFSGRGPILKIQNSQLKKPTGVLLIEGTVDLRRLGQPDFFSQVRLSSVQNALELYGWEMSPTRGTPGLQMRRAGAEGKPQVDLAYREDAQIGSEKLQRQEMEVSYPLSPQEQVSVRVSGQEEFVGVEHHRKF